MKMSMSLLVFLRNETIGTQINADFEDSNKEKISPAFTYANLCLFKQRDYYNFPST